MSVKHSNCPQSTHSTHSCTSHTRVLASQHPSYLLIPAFVVLGKAAAARTQARWFSDEAPAEVVSPFLFMSAILILLLHRRPPRSRRRRRRSASLHVLSSPQTLRSSLHSTREAHRGSGVRWRPWAERTGQTCTHTTHMPHKHSPNPLPTFPCLPTRTPAFCIVSFLIIELPIPSYALSCLPHLSL